MGYGFRKGEYKLTSVESRYLLVTFIWTLGLAMALSICSLAYYRADFAGTRFTVIIQRKTYRLWMAASGLIFMAGFAWTGASLPLKLVVGVGIGWYVVEVLSAVHRERKHPS